MNMKFLTGFYLGLAVFRRQVRLVVAKLSGHGVFDLKHFRLLTNPNLPIWLALLWIGFDLLVKSFGARRVTRMTASAKTFGFPRLEAQNT